MTEKDFHKCEDVFTDSQIRALRITGKASEEVGGKCRLVGGATRDCLMGVQNKDLDFVCLKPYDVADKIADYIELDMGKRPKVPIFKKYGTAQVVYKNKLEDREELEFVVPRKETYNPESIKPEVVQVEDFYPDTERRDFTLNTLALGVEDDDWMTLYDLTGMGLKDLKAGILRTPKDPDITFTDDPSRLMRLARFSACKEFDIEEKTLESAKKNAGQLQRVPKDFISSSMKKGIICDNYIQTLEDIGLITDVMPDVKEMMDVEQPEEHHKYDVWEHTKKVVDNLPKDYMLKFSGLWHDAGKGVTFKKYGNFHNHEKESEKMAKKWLNENKFSNKNIQDITYIVKNHMDVLNRINQKVSNRSVRRFANKHNVDGIDYTDELITFAYADTKASGIHWEEDHDKIAIFEKRVEGAKSDLGISEGMTLQLEVNGMDVMTELDIKPSEKVGVVLKDLTEKVVDGDLPNDKGSLINYIRDEYLKKN